MSNKDDPEAGCPASTISSPRRQLFLPANDNHFLPLRAKVSVRPRTFTFQRWFGAVGMRATCFWFPTFPFAFVAGAVEMWESRRPLARFPRGSGEEWEARVWLSTLSTAPAFPQLSFPPVFRRSVHRRLIRPRSGFPPVDFSWRRSTR